MVLQLDQMHAYKRPGSLVLVGILSLISSFAHADPLAAGQAAAKAGRLAEALQHYTAALQATPEGSREEVSLLEHIAALAPKVKPRPTIPGRALEHEGGCKAALQAAKTPQDAGLGVRECRRALRTAPWVPAYYFNLGVAYKLEGRAGEAIRQLELYLVANPGAKDEAEVRREIGALRVMGEQAAQEARRASDEQVQRELAERQRREQAERERVDKARAFASLSGTRWVHRCPGDPDELIVEFRVMGSRLDHRFWDSRDKMWLAWLGERFTFDAASGRIVRIVHPGDVDYRLAGIKQEIITINASNHLVWTTEYFRAPNRRCDLVPHR